MVTLSVPTIIRTFGPNHEFPLWGISNDVSPSL